MASTTTLANWRESDHNAWSFVHLDQLIPTLTVKKSTSPRRLVEERSSTIENLQIPADGKNEHIKDRLKATHTDGFVLLHRGKLIYDYYDNDNSASSKHIIMSLSKSLTSLIVGALVERGTIDVDKKVTEYMPELANTAFAPAMIRHLLDMRSGIKYPDDSSDYRKACGYNPYEAGEKPIDLPTFFSTFNPEGTEAPPAGFNYASVNTDVVGLLLERVTGKKFADLVHEHLWQPAGAEYDALTTVDSGGNPRAAGGICVSIIDLAKVAQAVVDGKVGTKAWLDDLLDGAEPEILAKSAWGPAFDRFSTTLGYRSWWTTSKEEGLLIGLGVYGQMIVIDLRKEIVFVKTSSQPGPFDPRLHYQTLYLFRAIQSALA